MTFYRTDKSTIFLTFNVPLNIQQQLTGLFDNASVGQVIREALRSASRPAVAKLKALTKAELVTDQSSGATNRSIDYKYGRSKKDPNKFYVVIGVNKSHFEYHSFSVPEGQKVKTKKGKARGSGLFAIQTRRQRKGALKSKQVFSTYKGNKYKKRFIKSRVFKRKPSKYFRLINNGFNHRFGTRAKAYNFISRAKAAVDSEMQIVFERRLQELLVPVLKRQVIRHLKNVFR